MLQAVRRDPFSTIAEIRREISRAPDAPVAGWWQVWGVLRRHRLLTRHARFRYVRGRW